ncbi:MAG: hypothetical protein ACFCVE_04030 [Phycisphaerae bacterium]
MKHASASRAVWVASLSAAGWLCAANVGPAAGQSTTPDTPAPVSPAPASPAAEAAAPVEVRTETTPAAWLLAAARADAAAKLGEILTGTPVAPGVTAGELAAGLKVLEPFVGLAADAQQVGAARHLGGGAVEVRLQLDGTRPATLLASAYEPRLAAIPRRQLDLVLERWGRTGFVSTGSAMPPALVLGIDLRQGVWRGVGVEQRRAVVAEALADACREGERRLLAVELAGAGRLGSALSEAALERHIRPVIRVAPVTRMTLTNDGEVSVRLYMPPAPLASATMAALEEETAARVDGEYLTRLIESFATSVRGSASLQPGQAALAAEAGGGAGLLPGLAPAWSEQVLRAEGAASLRAEAGEGGRRPTALQAARQAEQAATAALRARVGQLPLGRNMTLGQAAAGHPALARAVEAAMASARRSDTRIGENDVEVEVSLDGGTLWRELRDAR